MDYQTVLEDGIELARFILNAGPYRSPKGDASYFEETLYQYRGALYIHGKGGHISPYRELMSDGYYGSGESIHHVSEREAQEWMADRFGGNPDNPIDKVEVAP